MGLRFDVLPRVLYQPRQAFESIRTEATLFDGISMALLLVAVAQAITVLPSLLISGSGVPLANPIIVVVMAAAMLALKGAIASSMSEFVSGKHGTAETGGVQSRNIINVLAALTASSNKEYINKTIAMLGYASVLSVVLAVFFATLSLVFGVGIGTLSMNTIPAYAAGPAAALAVLFVIWSFWISANAVAVATETTFWKGFVAYLIGALGAGIVFQYVLALAGIATPSVWFL